MRLTFSADAEIQTGNAEGIVVHRHRAGETVEVPDDVAAMFLEQGAAAPAKAERSVRPRGQRAVKR